MDNYKAAEMKTDTYWLDAADHETKSTTDLKNMKNFKHVFLILGETLAPFSIF